MKAKKGLEGIIADESAISKVIPEKSALIYRGYPVDELAKHFSFLEIVYLLWEGELPSQKELDSFKEQEKQARKTDDRILQAIEKCHQSHPMDALRTAVSLSGALDKSPWDDSEEVLRKKALNLLANIPLWISAHSRFRKKLPLLEHSSNKDFVENFFQLYFGEIPRPEVLSAFSASLILYAEHGFNASTWTARVISSTTSDIYSAVVGAIGSLKGPLHGGANEQVMYMMKKIKEPKNAKEWIYKALAEKQKIMGFGHRVYKQGDSRVPQMFACAKTMAEVTHNTKWIQIYDILKEIILKEKGIHPNLDFPAGPAYYMMGFDIDVFTPLFVMSRISGWVAHIQEQKTNNRIIRPLCEYIGPNERPIPSAKQVAS